MTALLPWLYLLALLAVGWRLFRLRWPPGARVAAAIILTGITPMLFIVPALLHPEQSFADLQMAIGMGMLASGAVALLLGAGAAWLWKRRKGA